MQKSKYQPFTTYLISSNKKEIELSYNEIKRILGFMPLSALKYQSPWNDNNRSPFSKSWTNAGYTIKNNFKEKKAVFLKTGSIISKGENNLIKVGEEIKNSVNFDIDILINAIKRFHYSLETSNTTRYKSWEYCYNFFIENYNNSDKLDLLSLNLAWYLASWGMLRGKAFLRNYDYKIHYKLIKTLTEKEFHPLFEEPNKNNTELIFKAVEVVKQSYLPNKPTDTLITKILLGIFGCVPAYDRFFINGIKKYNIAEPKLSVSSINKLYNLYSENELVFQEITNTFVKEGVYYTPMKLIDMAFFQIGLEIK